jgi:hypothetical protein
MLKIFVFVVLVSVFSGCHAQKNLKFSAYKQTFILSLPEGYKLKKYFDDEGTREYHAIYPDSSIVYITDDNKSGSVFNRYKLQKYGKNVAIKINVSDTLTLEGIQPDKRYWKEKKIDQIVIGYMNIPKEKTAIFDHVLSSLNNGNRTKPK